MAQIPAQSVAEAGLSSGLAAVCGAPVQDRTLDRAQDILLDWCGLTVAAVNEPGARAISQMAQAVGGAGPCTAFATGDLTPEQAAFVNGSLGTLLEMDDLHRASILHAGDVVIPAALSMGQHVNCSGAQLAQAIVLGYEVALRIGQVAASAGYSSWYNSATCGVFGAAMAAAHAAGASDVARVDALGQAGMMASGLWQCRLETTDSKPVATAHAARAGVTAALLGCHGVRGARQILEGPLGFFATLYPDAIPKDVLSKSDQDWLIHAVSFKPWPACRHVHPALGLALDLGAPVDQILRVEVETYGAAIAFCDQPDPQTAHAARFSLQHCVAVALLRGGFELSDTSPAGLSDPETAALRARIHLCEDERMTARFPAKMGARIRIHLRDGTTQVAASDHARGDPEQPLSAAALQGKFHANLASVGIARRDADRLAASIAGLRAADTLDALTSALRSVSPSISSVTKGS